jgi:hypothetical protein
MKCLCDEEMIDFCSKFQKLEFRWCPKCGALQATIPGPIVQPEYKERDK